MRASPMEKTDRKNRKGGRWPLYVIIAVAVGTPLLSTALYFLAPPSGTTNRGELIEPVELAGGILPEPGTSEEVWHLLALGESGCGEECKARLCTLRQVRLVHLGEKDRIGRVWLLTEGDGPPAELTMEPGCGRGLEAADSAELGEIDILDGVTVAPIPGGLLDRLPEAADRASHLYLVDPRGRVMMRYRDGTPAKDIAKDLSRLLRLSRRA